MTYSTERGSLISDSNLATLCAYAETAPPGAFVEVGVYRGGSARKLYEIAERQGRLVYLIDTFAGHPEPMDIDDRGAHPAGRFADCIHPEALRRELPRAIVLEGRIPHDYPDFQRDAAPIAFAHIDVDLYESTLYAIRTLAPLMVRGGVMYFDDYGVPDCPGATIAVHECFPLYRIELLTNGKALVRFV